MTKQPKAVNPGDVLPNGKIVFTDSSGHTKLASIGDKMPDGTLYAGISPDTQQPMFAAPADASVSMDFNKAARYANGLAVGDKKDFRLPSLRELAVLSENRKKGAFKDTFNLGANYWSSFQASRALEITTVFGTDRIKFGGVHILGTQENDAWDKDDRAYVRCVR